MFDEAKLLKEVKFKAVKSAGAGGQHVNKTASRVELVFNIDASEVLKPEQKFRLIQKLKSKLSKNSDIILKCSQSRSQHKNKSIVIQRFLELLTSNLVQDKARIPTKMSFAVKCKRLDTKKKNSLKKTNRKPPKMDF